MSIRTSLGDFCSIVCFKQIIAGVEDVLGDDGAATVMTRAGIMRGYGVASENKMVGSNLPVESMAETLDRFLGQQGTCLCQVNRVEEQGESLVVHTSETVCSAGESQGSKRLCTYTLGAVQGFLEAVTGKKFLGQHTESVLRGGKEDVFTFIPRD